MKSDPNSEFIDPISLDVMRDPVLLSSGICVDRESAMDMHGVLLFTKCPITQVELKNKVYPVKFLKGKLTDWLVGRFNNAILIAQEFKDQKPKFDEACDLAESILLDLDTKTYKKETEKFLKLILCSDIETMSLVKKSAYKRVFKHFTQAEKDKFIEIDVRAKELLFYPLEEEVKENA